MLVKNLPIGVHKGTFEVLGWRICGVLHHPDKSSYFLYSNDERFSGYQSSYFKESFKDIFKYSYWIGESVAIDSKVLSLGPLLLGEL